MPQVVFASGNQERYLLAEAASERCFAIPVSYRIRGFLDVERLEWALRAASGRHIECRTTFRRERGGFLVVRHDAPRIDFRHIRLPSLDPSLIEAAVLPSLRRKPDFGRLADLHRHVLVERAPDDFVLVLSQHHAVSDGQSMEIFASEVFTMYGDRTPPPAGDPDEARRSILCRAPDSSLCDEFWRRELSGVETVPELRPDLDGGAPSAGVHRQTLDAEATAALQRIAAEEGLSLYNLLGAAFAAQAARIAGGREAVFSIQSAGRRGLDSSIPLIGAFSNALILRAPVDPEESLLVLARTIRAKTKAALANERVPYHGVQRLSGVSPKLAFNFYPAERRPVAEGLEIGSRVFLDSDSDYALNLRWSLEGGALNATAFHDPGRVSAGRVAGFLERTERLLERFTCASAASAATLLRPPHPAAPAPIIPPATRIHARFFESAETAPERLALRSRGEVLSYGALRDRTLGLAARLAASGASRGDRVAILTGRRPSLPVAMLAASRLGLPFAVLDPAYPGERLAAQLRLLRPAFLICEDVSGARLGGGGGAPRA